MNEQKIIDRASLQSRRYASFCHSRKEWFCNYCGAVVPKGSQIEHSYSADMKDGFAICADCSHELKEDDYQL